VKRHVLLVGLPGSGKTTVGTLVAQELGAAFVDVDAAIIRREGRPVTLIFAEKGEAAFRDMERREVEATLARDPAVIAPGGGWAVQPGVLAQARAAAFIVYLRTKPDTATRRVGPGNRPTLMGGDPLDLMRDLLRDREVAYLEADATVDTDGRGADDVATEVVRLARAQAGW
jgi:shikimate kinase